MTRESSCERDVFFCFLTTHLCDTRHVADKPMGVGLLDRVDLLANTSSITLSKSLPCVYNSNNIEAVG